MITFEREVIEDLSLPSIPKKEWDGKTSFKCGVAVTRLANDYLAYAVCTFDAERGDKVPYVTKAFAQEPFYSIEKIFPVPSFMETDVEKMDLDDDSKKAAEMLVKEAKELEEKVNDSAEETERPKLPKNEYYFDHIHSDEEAIAFISAYNKDNGIRGAVPTKHETLLMRLSVIYSELNKNNS